MVHRRCQTTSECHLQVGPVNKLSPVSIFTGAVLEEGEQPGSNPAGWDQKKEEEVRASGRRPYAPWHSSSTGHGP